MLLNRTIVQICCVVVGLSFYGLLAQGEDMNVSSETLSVESTAFKAGQPIPPQYTCDANNISPSLSWAGVVQGTESFVLICDDPDAPGKTWVHWVVFNIPAGTTMLPENIEQGKEAFENGMRQGKTDFGKIGYGGPCPPSGVHRYFFKIYALSKKLDLAPGATKKMVEEAMKESVLGFGQLMGTYQRSGG